MDNLCPFFFSIFFFAGPALINIACEYRILKQPENPKFECIFRLSQVPFLGPVYMEVGDPR